MAKTLRKVPRLPRLPPSPVDFYRIFLWVERRMEEKVFPRNYEPTVVEVLEALSLTGDGRNMKVVGSASLRRIQYAGDYDANEVSKESIPVIAKKLGEVIRRLKKIPLLVIGDIKCGEWKGEAIRWTPKEMEDGGEALEDALRAGGRTKIDTMAVIGNRYVEIGCVYMYGENAEPPDENIVVKQLEESIEEELADKNYWKALKRYFSILRLTEKDEKKQDTLVNIFNSDLGRLYSVISDISILEYLLENNVGKAEIMGEEIAGFRARLANIWSLPEFIKAEPGFDKTLEKASEKPREALTMLKRLKGRLNGLLQDEAKIILSREVKLRGKK